MSGLSYDIDKLLIDIQGGGQQQNSASQLHTGSFIESATTTSSAHRYSTSYSPNPRHPVNSSLQNQYSFPGLGADIEDYEAPLDAFDEALLAGPQEAVHRFSRATKPGRAPTIQEQERRPHASDGPYEQRQSSRPALTTRAAAQNRLSLRQPFQTPPSQLIAELSSPAYRPPSSPLAGVVQRREAQAPPPGGYVSPEAPPTSVFPSYRCQQEREQPSTLNRTHAPPIVQGIQLVAPNALSDRFRSIFPFHLFNAVQSKCYETAYQTSDNLVVSAPTGSGKTVVLELSICQLLAGFQPNQFKIVYMAPTKSLCAERQKDWQAKLAALDLQCAELTGDTDQGQLRNVQNANIVITTPEKWDSMTRKWKDHAKLMELVKLFLIDEVHILKESRGACLEAVVSRMKSVGSNVRFIALSATVPNSEDIASWLGRNPTNQLLPAHRDIFGEEFRPVKLQKHVYGLQFSGNDWGFDKACDPKLPEIIAKHSQKKPIMVFCITRKSTVSTAKLLANWWSTKGARERQWAGPTFKLAAQDPELKETLAAGVAFHHAGLDASDRQLIEKGFLEGQVNVICCTSTLAVGVNLPCHMVIIKNTMCFQEEGLKEYSDLEIMQMLGRAGRPQFEETAVAVIITKQGKLQKYEKMVSGQELLESSLHLNLIEHLNAEIGLGTIDNLPTAKRWLAGTFLYVRLGHNPAHYKLDGDAANLNLDDRIGRICHRDIDLLLEAHLVARVGDKIKCTEFGEAMARYYINFETMKGLLSIEPRSKMSDILSVLVGAEELRDVRYRAAEKKLLKDINSANGIKYPIKVDIALSQHKRSLIIQSELGGVEFPADEQYGKFQRQYSQDKFIIFNHIHRLVRCVIDCQIHLQDAVSVRHALELARSFAARVWDNSPYQMKQVPNIGPAAVRRLANGGINSIESLESAEPHKIEMLMSKNPPFGSRILASLKDFPKLRVSVKMMGKHVKPGQPPQVKIRAELGFLNEKPPAYFHRKAVHVCFLAERSDGHLIDFRRVSAQKLKNGQDILFSAELLQHTQFITCYVMCDELAGTMRYAELKPSLPPSMFPSVPLPENQDRKRLLLPSKSLNVASPSTVQGDERLYDDGVADEDIFEAAAQLDFHDIEDLEMAAKSKGTRANARGKSGKGRNETHDHERAPQQLENGKWACNHKCKDKKACKHFCCHEGVDKPRPSKKASAAENNPHEPSPKLGPKGGASNQGNVQTMLQLGKSMTSKKSNKIETVNLANKRTSDDYAKIAPRAYRALHQLHAKVNKDSPASVSNTKPSFSYKMDEEPSLTLLDHSGASSKANEGPSSDYESGWMDDLPSPSDLLQAHGGNESVLEEISADREGPSSQALRSDPGDLEIGLGRNAEEQQTDDSTIFADNEYDEAMENIGPVEGEEASRYFAGGLSSCTAKETSPQKLFMSTDSPEKPSSPARKRRHSPASEPDPDDVKSVPEAKRGKLDEDCAGNDVPPSPIKGDDGPVPAVQTIKPGYPDWVYEFDPAFVAEWEPYVEFV